MIECPNGHTFEPAPIVYGLPAPETMERANRGEIILGGCAPGEPVERACPTCGRAVVVSELVSGDPAGVEGEPPDWPI
jgi:hypothetical protein